MKVSSLNFGRLAAILAVGTGALMAQGVQTGNLAGKVTNQRGAPIVGAAVRLNTGRGIRTAVTNERGEWRMPLLSVGPCTLNVTANGYLGQKANVHISLGQTNVVNFILREMAVASVSVEITSSTQEIDPTTVTDGKNTSAADFANLPINARSVASIASITPGVVNNTIRGAQSNHTQWLIDGVDVMDPVTGGGIMYLNEETIQEVQVVTGGATADMGRFTGGMVNVVTKSGTNQFQGTLRYEITNPNWQAMRPMAEKVDSQHSTLQLYHISGPIWKDHIFFSVGYRNVSPITKTVGYTTAEKELGGNQKYFASNTDERMDLKLDWHITPYHRVFALYNNTKMDRFGIDYPAAFFDGGSTTWETLSAQPDEYGNVAFGYVGTLADNLVIKANYGKKNEKLGGPGGGGQGGPDKITMIEYNTETVYDNGFFSFDSDKRPVENGTLSVNWFLDSPFGSHDLKFGLDYFKSSRNAANAQSPTNCLVFFDGFINDPATYGTGVENRNFEGAWLEHYPTFEGATNSNTIWSYFVNDKAKFNEHFSANLGLRVDKFSSENDIKARNFDITAYSPRLTLVYDPFANGRWIFEAGYNQYAGQIMQGATDGASLVGNPALYAYDYIGGRGDRREDYSDTPFYVYNPEKYRNSNLIDPNMKPPTMDEISLVARFSDGKRGFYSLSFATRRWKNFVSTWAYEQEHSLDDDDMVVKLIANDPTLKRDYKGIEFQWEKQFTDSFNWGGNITISETRGNFEGGQTGSSGPLRLYGPLDYYEPSFNESGEPTSAYQPTERQLAPYGAMGNDRPLTIRTWATWQKDVFGAGHVNLGLYAEYNSGAPYSNTASARLYNYVNVLENPYGNGIYGASYTRYFTQRGALRFNNWYNTSLQVSYDHAICKGVKAFGTVNITNLFNHQIQIDWNTSGSSVYNTNAGIEDAPAIWRSDSYNRPDARFLPGANYGLATGASNYLGARNIRLMLGLRF